MQRVNLYGFICKRRIQLLLIPVEVRGDFMGIKFVENDKDFARRVWAVAESYAISFPVWCEPS